MKKSSWKYPLLAAVLSLCLLLSGCYVPPDDVSDNNVITGSNNLPFDAVATDTVAPVLPAVTRAPTNEPSTTGGISIDWNNWGTTSNPSSQSTGVIGGTVTAPPSINNSTSKPTTVVVKTAPPVATAKPGATTPPTILKKGSKGDSVRAVQKRLKELGYLTGSSDGDYGDITVEAVKAFQKNNGLKADGQVGPNTLAKLNSSSAKKATAPVNVTKKPAAKVTAKPTAKPTSTPNVSNTYLESGNSGTKVKQMQNRLISLGWLAGKANGEYDAATQAAVIAFQKKCGLWQDGKAGPNTLKLLYSSSAPKSTSAAAVVGESLKLGSSGAAVRVLQERLKSLGYLKNSPDGSYGENTEAAVMLFQQQNGLKADGKAGSTTLNKLFSENARKYNEQGEGTVTSGDAIASTGYTSLRMGSTGDGVKQLQTALKKQGYYKGSVDGKFGQGTEDAVYAFQAAKKLKEDGIAGPATQRALYNTNTSGITYSTLRKGDSGSAVSNLQYTLYELGYYDGSIDGKYGDTTQDAVRAFQIANNITPVDGVAGNKTLQALYSSSAVSSTTPTMKFTTLKLGDQGEEVLQLQDMLYQLGYYNGSLSGVFDDATEKAVFDFQTRNGLKADGKAGEDTQRVLFSDKAIVAK